MGRKSKNVGISIYHEQAEWLKNISSPSRYIQQCFDWRMSRFKGACVFLRRIDKRLVEKAIGVLEGMDWPWYPDPEAIAERLAASEGDEYWVEFVEAVKQMPRLSYALEAVAREVYSANAKASEFI